MENNACWRKISNIIYRHIRLNSRYRFLFLNLRPLLSRSAPRLEGTHTERGSFLLCPTIWKDEVDGTALSSSSSFFSSSSFLQDKLRVIFVEDAGWSIRNPLPHSQDVFEIMGTQTVPTYCLPVRSSWVCKSADVCWIQTRIWYGWGLIAGP